LNLKAAFILALWSINYSILLGQDTDTLNLPDKQDSVKPFKVGLFASYQLLPVGESSYNHAALGVQGIYGPLQVEISYMALLGKSYDQVQKELSIGREAVAKWKGRFLDIGIQGLMDKPGRGAKPKYSDEDRARIVQKACEKPEGGYTSWSQRRIAKELGMSQSTVQKTLKEHILKPHKVDYWCGKSTDPEFEAKMLNVIGLYLNPDKNAMVLSVDEKTQIQALDRSQPELPLRSGNAKRLTATYKRNGTVSLIAALAVHHGEITAQTIEKNNHENFLKFLKKLYRKYPKKHLHIIADNLTVHQHKKINDWTSTKKRITMHFTPTYSSWLNQVEIWFNILTKDVLKGGVWRSKKQLVDQIIEYIDTYNKTRAKPFEWTYNGSTN
jgi:putative transposase